MLLGEGVTPWVEARLLTKVSLYLEKIISIVIKWMVLLLSPEASALSSCGTGDRSEAMGFGYRSPSR